MPEKQGLLKQEVGQFVLRSTYLLILCGTGQKCLNSRRSQLFIRRLIQQTAIIIEPYRGCQLHTKLYPAFCCQSKV